MSVFPDTVHWGDPNMRAAERALGAERVKRMQDFWALSETMRHARSEGMPHDRVMRELAKVAKAMEARRRPLAEGA